MKLFRKKKGPNTLSLLYEEARVEPEVRRGLNWILAGNLFGNMHGTICGGGSAAMVGLAGLLGAGDMEFGLLVALPQMAALMQLPFSVLVNRTHKRKIWLMTFGVFSRILWLIFGFLPLLNTVPESKLPLYTLITLLGMSSICGAAINVCWFPWFSDMAPMRIRGRWLSYRDMIIAVANLLFGLLVAYLLDVLPVDSKYVIIFLIGGMLGVMDMVCFGFVKEKWTTTPPKMQLRKSIMEILHNKHFMHFVWMWTAWCFTANLSGAYLTPYAMNTMGLGFMQITVFGSVAAAVATVVAVPRWGQALDRFGSRNVMMISAIGASLTPAFYVLSTPGSVWPTFLHNVIGALFWSGTNLAANNLQLSSSPDENRPMYIAVFSCVAALVGTALGTMSGGWFLEACQSYQWFTGSFDRYKVLIVMSVVMRFAITLWLVPGLKNDQEGTVKDVLAFFNPFKKKNMAVRWRLPLKK